MRNALILLPIVGFGLWGLIWWSNSHKEDATPQDVVAAADPAAAAHKVAAAPDDAPVALPMGGAAAPTTAEPTPTPTAEAEPEAPPERTIPSSANAKIPDIEQYLSRASNNPEAKALMGTWLHAQREKHDIGFVHETLCRGFVCKSLLTFKDLQDARKLFQVDHIDDSEFVFTALSGEDDSTVTIYSTLPGTSFAEIVGAQATNNAQRGRDARSMAKAVAERWATH